LIDLYNNYEAHMQFVRRFRLLSVVLALAIVICPSVWPQDASRKDQETAKTQRLLTEFEKTPLMTTSLGDNIYLFSGDSANVLAISNERSVLLIDSGSADRVTELAHAVYQIAHRPVTTVVNTDWHSDHTGGNPYFSSFGVTIIAQANTRNRIAAEYKAALKTYVPNNQSAFKVAVSPWSAAVENEASLGYALRGIPSIAFNDSMIISMDTEELHFFHYRAAHTDGDTVVFFEKANIAVMGEIFPGNSYPWIDLASGGSLAGIIETLDRVLSMSNEETRIVPARGALVHKGELQNYRDMLAAIQARVKALIESGATADQVLAAAPTSDFDAQWGGGNVSGGTFTSSVVNSIARAQ
jgi:glyoxylase-like metal-dependent hydrolase (beta-lactamase superfamily II)